MGKEAATTNPDPSEPVRDATAEIAVREGDTGLHRSHSRQDEFVIAASVCYGSR